MLFDYNHGDNSHAAPHEEYHAAPTELKYESVGFDAYEAPKPTYKKKKPSSVPVYKPPVYKKPY